MRDVLLGRSVAELEDWAVAQGQKAFRGRQLHDWLYAKGARTLTEHEHEDYPANERLTLATAQFSKADSGRIFLIEGQGNRLALPSAKNYF